MSASRRSDRLFPRLFWGALWRRRERLAIALAAVAIGAAVAAGLLLVSLDVDRQVSRELKSFGPNVILLPAAERVETGVREVPLGAVSSRGTLAWPPATWEPAPVAEVRLAETLPLLYGSARAVLRPIRWETVIAAGTDLAALDRLYAGWRRERAATPPDPARVPLVIGRAAATRLRVTPGDTLTLMPLVAGGEPLPAAVAQVVEAGGTEDELVYLPLAGAQRLLGRPGRVSVALARVEGLPERIEAALASGWLGGGDRSVRPLRRMAAAESQILARLRALLGTITVLALAAAALSAMSTLTDLVLERRREIAVLKALGASRRGILALFLAEAAALGLAGGVIGFALGGLAAQIIGHGGFDTGIRLDLGVLPIVLALALAVTLVASLPPVRYALAVQPADVLRGE